jgi:hypothetical protein
MKILKSGIEMTPEELIASKAGKACACACQEGFDTENLWGGGSEETECECGCIQGPFSGSASSARTYPY